MQAPCAKYCGVGCAGIAEETGSAIRPALDRVVIPGAPSLPVLAVVNDGLRARMYVAKARQDFVMRDGLRRATVVTNYPVAQNAVSGFQINGLGFSSRMRNSRRRASNDETCRGRSRWLIS